MTKIATNRVTELVSFNGIADGGAVETVIRTSNPVIGSGFLGQVLGRVSGIVIVTPGVAATFITVRIRQTDINGAIIGTSITVPCTPGVAVVIPVHAVDFIDTIATATGQVYCLTVQETAATGPGTITHASLAFEACAAST